MLVTDVDAWVLKRAIGAAARWHGDCWPGVRVAVILSPRRLLDESFADRVRRLLKEARPPPSCLEIELTKYVLQAAPKAIEALRRLRVLGGGRSAR